ncbi:glycerate kinase family protein [Belliella aquatica]|uniref:Glycerate kinase n=1 Tax=Belliella aquatica TaxID=1323734 RepID=A0ABQ1LYE4_9BACT|nr:glycerate kinase [Belliella aquatica]MCH7405792.1 glycerate kinase [Belliella aquatica]GGC30683.1 glycerate kinase [Belliella aquatica]
MKILVAPNAFKGSIDADDAASIIGSTLLSCNQELELDICPIADGGDGTCFLLGKALGLKRVEKYALDAIGRPYLGFYYLQEDQQAAYFDISTVSGLKNLKSHQMNPRIASSYGTGELIQHANSHGAKNIILGLGGSASIDLGIGILRALGYLFLDENGRELSMFSESLLQRISHIQIPIKKIDLRFTVLCDVGNTFFGPNGAIPVFGLQKGLEIASQGDYFRDCERFIEILSKKIKKDIPDQAGFGAAGGIAYGLSHFFPVNIKMGSKYFFEQINMKNRIRKADLIITGEGRYDYQSASGKGSYELLQLAKKHQKKTILITSGNDGLHDGFDQVGSLPDLDFENQNFKAIAEENLRQVIIDIYRSIKAS